MTTQPCGTKAAYQRHLVNHEEPCDPCKAANSEHRRTHFDANRERNRLYQQAIRTANKRLQTQYPDAWAQLLRDEKKRLGVDA